MPLVKIIGMKKGIFDDTGHAAISVDAREAYDGRATWKRCSFDITDTEQRLAAQATSQTASSWHAFLGHGSHVIRDAGGSEITRITYAGLFGHTRTATVGHHTFPLARRPIIKLPGATISLDRWRRTAEADVHAPDSLLAYLSIAFALWLLEDTTS